MTNFYDFTLKELEDFLKEHGKQRFRAEQLFRWVYQKGVTNFDDMSNLAKDFREEMKSLIKFELPKVTQQLDSVDGLRSLRGRALIERISLVTG